MTQQDWNKAVEGDYYRRRDRLDRFVAAAVTGLLANPQCNASPIGYAEDAIQQAEVVLAELERREKEGK